MTRAAALACLVLLGVTQAAAQQPTPPPRDTARRDGPPADTLGAPRDSLAPDSAAADTAARWGDAFLELKQRALVRVPAAPRLARPVSGVPLYRKVISRDSLDWAGADNLADLLSRVAGLYVWRAGWLGREAMPNFQARGATSVEYVLDGMPLLPVGPDSVAFDPTLVALGLVESVEIERYPGLLRVRLDTRRHDRLAPASRIALGAGTASFAQYGAGIETRSRSGLGFGAEVDYQNISGAFPAPTENPYRNFQFWLQGSWVPSPRRGVIVQAFRLGPARSRYTDPINGQVLGDSLNGQRLDVQARGFLRARADGRGLGADLVLSRTSWGGQDISQAVTAATLGLSWRSDLASTTLSGTWRDRWSPLTVALTSGWTPSAAIGLGLEAQYQSHDGGRSSAWVAPRGSLRLPYGVVLGAAARAGQAVAAPAVTADTAQALGDLEASVAIEQPWLTAVGRFTRLAAFQAVPYQQFPTVPGFAPAPATTWIQGELRVRPLSWLTFEGWGAHPTGTVPDGQPPRHVAGQVTFRSRFQRAFPSGVLELKLQAGAERWEEGVIGRATDGSPIALPGTTFLRAGGELRFGDLHLYVDGRNTEPSAGQYVPGYVVPQQTVAFGIRWKFVN